MGMVDWEGPTTGKGQDLRGKKVYFDHLGLGYV